MLVSAKEMLDKAKAGKYAVGHFNINNLEWTKAILLTAQENNSPVILGVSEGAGKYMGGYTTVVGMVNGMLKELGITVPVALHLDHGSYEAAKECIEKGFSSVMFDGSKYDIEENVAKTKEIVALAHSKGISVEAEVGAIGGEEDGVLGGGEIADPDECAKICRAGRRSCWLPASATSTASTRKTGLACAWMSWQRSRKRPATMPSGSARRHRHPGRDGQGRHQQGRFQDQRQHRVPDRLHRGNPQIL